MLKAGFTKIWAMASASNEQANIVRTERGLTIAGTRITLYDVMDYFTAGYPAKLIREKLCLTDAQVNAALYYIEAHQAEVEADINRFYELQKRTDGTGKNVIENILPVLLQCLRNQNVRLCVRNSKLGKIGLNSE